jgi:hypothetical protein
MPGICVFAALSGFKNFLCVYCEQRGLWKHIGDSLLIEFILELVQLSVCKLLEHVKIFQALPFCCSIAGSDIISCCRNSLTHVEKSIGRWWSGCGKTESSSERGEVTCTLRHAGYILYIYEPQCYI